MGLMRRLLLAVLTAALAASLPAQQKRLDIRAFHAEIAVNRDATLDVTERITVHFTGSWNGILRWIPTRGTTRWGEVRSISILLDAVEDGEGRALQTWTTRRSNGVRYRIRVPGAQDATHEVVIRYRVLDAVHRAEAEGWDEFYWNVTGLDWPSGIADVSCRVLLPDDAEVEDVRAAVGPRGAVDGDDADIRQEGTTIRFDVARPLAHREGLTILVGIAPGAIELPGLWTRLRWALASDPWIVVPPLLLLLVLAVWLFWGRDAHVPDAELFDGRLPPELSPAEIGVLADDRLQARDVAAQILWLGERGFLHAKHTGEDRYRLEKVESPKTEPDDLDRTLLECLFDDDDSVTTTRLSGEFRGKLGRIRDVVEKRLVGAGHYRFRPSRARRAGVASVFVLVFLLIAVGVGTSASGLYWILALVCIAAATPLLWNLPSKTRSGAELLGRIRAFESRARAAEEPLDSHERAAAYALGLLVEDDDVPSWIDGDDGEPARRPHFLTAVSAMVWTLPRSHATGGGGGFSGGGFSGGGFSSGGGFGGGGGGGW